MNKLRVKRAGLENSQALPLIQTKACDPSLSVSGQGANPNWRKTAQVLVGENSLILLSYFFHQLAALLTLVIIWKLVGSRKFWAPKVTATSQIGAGFA